MKKIILFLALVVFFSAASSAATVHGTVYDLYLDEKQDAVVFVNTTPKQTHVAKDASYSFQLPAGSYNLTAAYSEGGIVREQVSEIVSIGLQGEYNVDLILFPVFEEDVIQQDDIVIGDDYFEQDIRLVDIALFASAAIVLGLIGYILLRYRKMLAEVSEEVKKASEDLAKTEASDLVEGVLGFIKDQGGRTTQKDIRKHFPSSEAKISLVISELEQKGTIKKFKKGRGNIIILEK